MNGSKSSNIKSGRSFLSAVAIAILITFVISGPTVAQEETEMNAESKPTIVLVHGAFADSSSWEAVTRNLLDAGYPVIAAANPLRGLQNDADYVSTVLNSIEGPIVLVGHSYGGMVISNAVKDNRNVQALVFVNAFTPEIGESISSILTRFPGSTLAMALNQVALPNGVNDLYIQQDKFRAEFAADVPEAETRWMAATQRPVTDAALSDVSSDQAWKIVPSWFIYGSLDLAIPPAAMAFMAERADSQETVVIEGGSHVVMISHPDEVSRLIETAAETIEAALSAS